MFSRLLISLVIFLFGWTHANACTPTPEATSGVQNYHSIKPNAYTSWFDPNLTVGLVYAKKKKTRKRKVLSGYNAKNSKKPFVKIKFQLIQPISPDFKIDEPTWYPKIKKSGAAQELSLKGKIRDFSFWDRRDLSVAGIYGYSLDTSCGPAPSNTLVPNQYYLQFKRNDRTVGFEIVSGLQDPLVLDFIDIQSGKVGTKVRRSAKDYFAEMKGYQEVVVAGCPLADKFDSSFGFIHLPWQRSDNLQVDFKKLDTFKSDSDGLTLVDFYSYISFSNGDQLNCKIGDKYLVLERLSAPTPRGRGSAFSVNSPRHRYLKVENGDINLERVLSKIEIISEEEIHASLVKAWIREANK